MKKIFNVLLCSIFACHADMWLVNEACEQVYENNNFDARPVPSCDDDNSKMNNICIKMCQDFFPMDNTEIEMWRDCFLIGNADIDIEFRQDGFSEVDFSSMFCYTYKWSALRNAWALNMDEAYEQVYENNNFDVRPVPSCDAGNFQFSNIEADQDYSSGIDSDSIACDVQYSRDDLMDEEDSNIYLDSDGACEQMQADDYLDDIDYKIANMEEGVYRLADIDIKRIQYYKSTRYVPISNKLINEVTYQYNYAARNGILYERNLFLYSYDNDELDEADRYMFIDDEKEPFI